MAGATELTLDDRARIEALLTEYGWRIDHGGDVSDLFAPEGVVIAPGVGLTLQGREAIGSHFTARAANTSQVPRHVWCDLRVADFARDAARLHTTQMTFLRDSSEQPTAKHIMVGETHDVVRREANGEWRFLERRLEVIFPFDVDLGRLETLGADSPAPSRGLKDGVLYYVKSRSGEVSVARYLARHELFFAVGDAIGYFPDDLGAIGKPVPLDGAFDD